MSEKIIKFQSKKDIREERKQAFLPMNLEDELDKDIKLLAENLTITDEEAIQMATRFYKKYPVLMEYVKCPEQFIR